MTNLAEDTFNIVRGGPDILAVPVLKDALQVYHGSLLSISGPNAAADNGYVVKNAATVGFIPLGRNIKNVLGDITPTPGKRGQLVLHDRVERLVVTGVTAITDVGKPIYFTDDNVATLTRAAKLLPGGMILEHHSSTTCEVLVFGAATLAAMAIAGGQIENVYLGHFDWVSVADGNLRIGLPMQYHGEVKSIYAVVDIACTGSGGTTAINLEIDTVNVTGGVVTVSTAVGGTKGTVLAGTAITAGGVFHEGSVIDVEAASTSATRTTGTFDLFMVVQRHFGV